MTIEEKTSRGDHVKHGSLKMKGAKLCFYSNIFLASSKLVVGLFLNSMAVLTEAAHSIVDMFISAFLLYAVKTSDKPADPMHNYGYGKVEQVSAMFEGVMLAGVGLAMIVQSLRQLLATHEMQDVDLAIAVMFVGTIINLGIAWVVIRYSKEEHSPALYAEGIHFKLDGYVTAGVCGAFVVSRLLVWSGLEGVARFVDPVTAICVSLYLLFSSWGILKEAFFCLLDSVPEEHIQLKMISAIAKHEHKYCEIMHIRARTAGGKIFADFHLLLYPGLTVEESHEIVHTLEDSLKEEIPECEATIHVQPCDKKCAYMEEDGVCPFTPSHAKAAGVGPEDDGDNPPED